jgi:RHS repeat-associated protein
MKGNVAYRRGGAGYYRSGFQGAEKDDEINGASGTSYAFEYRIHDPRISRFLSSDPIGSKFPHNSPYAFSENRVIDGIDLEGSEYVHYFVFLNNDGTLLSKVSVQDFRGMTDAQIKSVHGMGSEEFYKKYSESFGEKGRGTQYTYFTSATDGGWIQSASSFDETGGVASHGHYYGGGGPSAAGTMPKGPPGAPWAGVPGSDKNKWTYEEKPIDEVDALARQHDMDYDSAEVSDWLKDPAGIPADLKFVSELSQFLDRASQKGYKDSFTGRAPSRESIESARFAMSAFMLLIDNKMQEEKKGK